MKNCPNCQTSNPDDHNFCLHCGVLIAPYCPRCQFVPIEGAHFCGKCGLALSPRAQFAWQQSPDLYTTGQTDPARTGREPETPWQPTSHVPDEPLPVPPSSASHLEQYIPKELIAKFEAARARGGMVGERRVVTMLFCDVKGSTAAAEGLDPEEWTEIINGAFEYMIPPVYKYEGTVARLMGDGILAFFGAPIAHEDDPERAVLAGLDIVAGIEPYRQGIRERWGIELSVRVGINTGLVVVGAVGSDMRMEYTAMGDAINLAARMEQTATPGSVQITGDTYRLVSPLFEFESLGGIEVKGKGEPVPAYRVLRRKSRPGRLRGIEGLEADMVGRSQEMEQLKEVLADLERGIGRIVCLLGRAGLGKSRLIRELRRASKQDGSLDWYETASLSYETGFPYSLFQQLVRALAGISAGDESDIFWEKAAALTAPHPKQESARLTRVISSLFGLPDPTGQPPLEGEQFRRELYTGMGKIWKERFASRPAVLAFDDLHWADPASVDLLLHLLPLVEGSPIVLLCAFRPDRESPSYQIKQAADSDHPHRYTEIRLQPLTESQSDEMVNTLLQIADLPDELRARIRERASGNPFFVEEVVRSLIEKGAVVAEERSDNGSVQRYWRATSSSAAIDIPDTLQGLLAARIDRLEEEARHVVQLASVIGRSFFHRVLAELGRSDKLSLETIEQQIGRLVRMEMIQEAARVPEVEYRFRNPLTQEIAYQSILLKRRREFHRRVGSALETLFPDQRTEMAPRLAYHFSEGQQAGKALAYFSEAADSAFRLFALENALQHYDQALAWAEKGDAGSEQLIHLHSRRGRTFELLLRYDDAMETYQDLEALGEARQDDSLRLAGIAAQGIAYTVAKFDFEKSKKLSEKALALARRLGDRRMEARSLWSLLLAHTWVDVRQALAHGENGLEVIRDLASGPQATADDRELQALLLLDLTIPLIGVGRVAQAREHAAEAREFFEETGNLPMASTAAQRQGLAYRVEGRFDLCEQVYLQSAEMDEAIGNEGGLVGSTLGLLDLYPLTGDYTCFFARLEDLKPILERSKRAPEVLYDLFPMVAYNSLGAIDQSLKLTGKVKSLLEDGAPVWPAIYLCHLARAQIAAGDPQAARITLDQIPPEMDMENNMIATVWLAPQAEAELALASGDFQKALAIVEAFIKKIHRDGMLGLLPEKLLLQGRILERAGQQDSACDALREAVELAREQGAYPVLWQAASRLAELEAGRGNSDEAQALRQQAREAIDFMAAHAGRTGLKSSFLAIPQVQSIISATGGVHDEPEPKTNE